jgi:hypothetical protein
MGSNGRRERVETSDRESAARPMNWAALTGTWSFADAHAIYAGPAESATVPYGLAVSDLRLRDGRLRVAITFDAVTDASAGLVLGFHSETMPYAIPQLGGWATAYAIAVFEPGSGWRSVVHAGSIKNLHANRAYDLDVLQAGQRIVMKVDGVQIFDHTLASPLPGNQIGLFGFGAHRITFSDCSAWRVPPRLFVAMQFGEPYDTLYREVIQPEASDLGFDVVRIDEVYQPGIIFEDIKRHIAEAKVVIAEITAPNQNVFYELGYAHALNKPTILLAQRGKDLPFDIRSYRVIFYDDTIGGKPVVERALQNHLHSILQDT